MTYRHWHAAIHAWTAANLRARSSYYTEPFAGTRDINRTDQARERMRATRAEKEKP